MGCVGLYAYGDDAMNTRHKNGNWTIPTTKAGNPESWDDVRTALLMDIRDELQTLNRLLACPNFIAIPQVLRSIRRNTAKPRKRK